MTYWAIFAAWYAFGWWYAQHAWRKEFDVTLFTATFITVFAVTGPSIGAIWDVLHWIEHRPKKRRKPFVVLSKHRGK